MKTILSSRRRHYLARVSTFLILLALIVGMVGCIGPYSLIIASTAGGSVATPGQGTYTYNASQVVNLVATPDPDYYFVSWTGDVGTIADVNDSTTTITMSGNYSITANFWTDIVQVAAGWEYTVGLCANGTVVAVGNNTAGSLNVAGWTNIVQVAAGGWHTVGLRADGTVVAVGNCTAAGQCNVTGWTNIVQVAADWFNTVGLKSDGTVVVAGPGGNTSGMYDVGNWTDIKQVAAGGGMYNLGLCHNGTVVAAETKGVYPDYGQCDVGNWTDIIQIDARGLGTLGLYSNRTVVATGYNATIQLNVTAWTNIIQVAAGLDHTVALKSDGTVVAAGYDYHGQCSDVASWDLIP